MKYKEIVDNAIEFSINSRSGVDQENIQNFIGVVRYAYEFKTIKIDLGRRVGKTTYIKNFALDCEKYQSKILIIVPTYCMKQDMFKELDPSMKFVDVYTVEHFWRFCRGQKLNYNWIIFDEPTISSRQNPQLIEMVYSFTATSNIYQTYLHIGS